LGDDMFVFTWLTETLHDGRDIINKCEAYFVDNQMSKVWAEDPCSNFSHPLVTDRIHFGKHFEADLDGTRCETHHSFCLSQQLMNLVGKKYFDIINCLFESQIWSMQIKFWNFTFCQCWVASLWGDSLHLICVNNHSTIIGCRFGTAKGRLY
jgi:hypothetical protein